MSKAKLYLFVALGVYVAMIVVTTIVLHNHSIDHPFLRSLLWPISLTRFLLGGLS